MSILSKLLKYKRREKSIIWGIRAPEQAKRNWLFLAALMRVPCNRLILFVLNDWLKANAATLLDDRARNQLAERITKAHYKLV
jgi:hypothetical protein